ncbi:MAG: hypothetical protein ACNI27_11120 [Desulfovibrio sp.]
MLIFKPAKKKDLLTVQEQLQVLSMGGAEERKYMRKIGQKVVKQAKKMSLSKRPMTANQWKLAQEDASAEKCSASWPRI